MGDSSAPVGPSELDTDLQEDKQILAVSIAFESRQLQVSHGVCTADEADTGSATHRMHCSHC